MKSYNVIGVFHHDQAIIEVPTDIYLQAEDDESALEKSESMNLGKVFYESASGVIFYTRKGKKSPVEEVYCEVLYPKNNSEREYLMGVPVYDDDDYKEVRLNEVLNLLQKEAVERRKANIGFENVAYKAVSVGKIGS